MKHKMTRTEWDDLWKQHVDRVVESEGKLVKELRKRGLTNDEIDELMNQEMDEDFEKVATRLFGK